MQKPNPLTPEEQAQVDALVKASTKERQPNRHERRARAGMVKYVDRQALLNQAGLTGAKQRWAVWQPATGAYVGDGSIEWTYNFEKAAKRAQQVEGGSVISADHLSRLTSVPVKGDAAREPEPPVEAVRVSPVELRTENAHNQPGGAGLVDDCDCEFDPMFADDPNAGEDDEGSSCHFKRTCASCGNVWGGLHCPHDGVQNPCGKCGVRPTTVPIA